MNRYRKNNKRRPRSKEGVGTLLGVVLGVVGILLIAAMIAANFWIEQTTTELDENNCPISGPSGIHVVMIDRSDPITEQQALRTKNFIDELLLKSKPEVRFDFFVFEGDPQTVLKPELSVCSSIKPKDANMVYQNVEKIRERYIENFTEKVDRTITNLTSINELETSPIIESIRSASLFSFGPVSNGKMKLELTLVSDMIQNSVLLSQYKTAIDFDEFSRKREWLLSQPSLKGASVKILYLLTSNTSSKGAKIQSRGHQNFWENLISASDGRLISIDVF